ncbi:hypothetical protein BZG36_00642 [Bifiguratus adelaidae]|uniref:Uncharacterized protein n=1 Tax=Bifiguratus adelaidae TaxID=1938954 RepID=A0A261Y7J2_9FUNG|nr:hypothetical protein BZG36_00642 [Bifiguratus adelaidae]
MKSAILIALVAMTMIICFNLVDAAANPDMGRDCKNCQAYENKTISEFQGLIVDLDIEAKLKAKIDASLKANLEVEAEILNVITVDVDAQAKVIADIDAKVEATIAARVQEIKEQISGICTRTIRKYCRIADDSCYRKHTKDIILEIEALIADLQASVAVKLKADLDLDIDAVIKANVDADILGAVIVKITGDVKVKADIQAAIEAVVKAKLNLDVDALVIILLAIL